MSLDLAKNHILVQERIRQTTKTAIRRLWTQLGHYDEADVQPFLDQVVPLVRAAQLQSVSAVELFLSRRLDIPLPGLDPEPLIGAGARNGVAPETVYRRPFVDVWKALGDGVPWDEAVDRGMARAMNTAATDVQLSMREAARAMGGAEEGIYGYERVADGSACDLCLIASTQRYHTDDLMPIHDNCGCGVEPLTEPTGRIANRERYDALKKDGAIDRMSLQQQAPRYEKRAAANRSKSENYLKQAAAETDPTRAAQLQQRGERWGKRADDQLAAANASREAARAKPGARAVVKQHGELGPVLVDPAHHFSLGG